MTNEDLITKLAQQLDLDELRVSELLDATVLILKEQLAENAQITIDNFGVFETKKIDEHIIVDSSTQERYLVPPEVKVVFNPYSVINDNNKKGEENE